TSTPTRSTRPASSSSASSTIRTPRSASSAARSVQTTDNGERTTEGNLDNALDTTTNGRTRRPRAAGWLLREPRHWHAHALRRLHPRRHDRGLPVRERPAGHGPLPARLRGRP